MPAGRDNCRRATNELEVRLLGGVYHRTPDSANDRRMSRRPSDGRTYHAVHPAGSMRLLGGETDGMGHRHTKEQSPCPPRRLPSLSTNSS